MNSDIEKILQRRSVRSFTDQKILDDEMNQILRAGMAAPTAVNSQPWEFIVVTEQSLLDRLAEDLPYAKMSKNAAAVIVVCGNIEKSLTKQNNDPYWSLDCSAATENILLASQALGLGGVWTAVYPDEGRMKSVSKILNLPEHIKPFNVIPLGHPAKDGKTIDKYKEERIHFNAWN